MPACWTLLLGLGDVPVSWSGLRQAWVYPFGGFISTKWYSTWCRNGWLAVAAMPPVGGRFARCDVQGSRPQEVGCAASKLAHSSASTHFFQFLNGHSVTEIVTGSSLANAIRKSFAWGCTLVWLLGGRRGGLGASHLQGLIPACHGCRSFHGQCCGGFSHGGHERALKAPAG